MTRRGYRLDELELRDGNPGTAIYEHAQPRSSGASSVIALTVVSTWNPNSSGISAVLRAIENVRSPADAAPVASQLFAETKPSSVLVTFSRSGAIQRSTAEVPEELGFQVDTTVKAITELAPLLRG